jgi:hypothetical protein
LRVLYNRVNKNHKRRSGSVDDGDEDDSKGFLRSLSL